MAAEEAHTAQDGQNQASPSSPSAQAEDPGHKVFVGNLNFKTSDADLAEHFGKCGKVVKASVIKHGRSLGYGFVAFKTLEQAEKAAKELNKSVLEDREINVEIAHPRPTSPTSPSQPRSPRTNRKKSQKTPTGGRSERHKENDDQQADRDGADKDENVSNGSHPPGRSRNKRAPLEPSGTRVYIGNLPYAATDQNLRDAFVDFQIVETETKVARKLNGRSKGYGFIELATSDEQQRLMDEMAKDEGLDKIKELLGDRPISFAVARVQVTSGDGDAVATGSNGNEKGNKKDRRDRRPRSHRRRRSKNDKADDTGAEENHAQPNGEASPATAVDASAPLDTGAASTDLSSTA